MEREEMKALLLSMFPEGTFEEDLINSTLMGYNNSNIKQYNSTDYQVATTLSVGRILAICIATVGIVANVISFAAMLHIPGSSSANQRLIINLIVSDMFVSVSLLFFLVNNAIAPFFLPGEDYGTKLCVYTILKSLVMMGHTISLFSLVVLAFDHFLAINRPLKYLQIFTSRRVTCVLLGIWLFAALCGFSDFIVPAPKYIYCQERIYVNFCEIGYCSRYETEYLLFPLVHVCFVIMVFLYSRVFFTIYKYQNMAGRHQRHMKRNIKGLITTMLILGTFILCWSPHCIFEAYFLLKIIIDPVGAMGNYKFLLKMDFYLYALWLVNSVCDPVIYGVRMREVKTGYSRMIRCYLVTRELESVSRRPTLTSLRRSVTTSITCELMENNTLGSPGTSSM